MGPTAGDGGEPLEVVHRRQLADQRRPGGRLRPATKPCKPFEPGQRARASRPARTGTTIAAGTGCSAIRGAGEPASQPKVRSGTKDSAFSTSAVRTKVTRGR